jgi:hypothetical protein
MLEIYSTFEISRNGKVVNAWELIKFIRKYCV